ncbi:MAG TPA: dihydrolipoamide acetyltransferase family protein, partial [Polyangia bacterium]|nr:dihydrolipoamide acetyltransferase family protein [Polyangia bacterium]
MLYEFRLPDIGEGVVEGEVVRWLVKEGDLLREDQPMVEVMTDKATVEIPAPRAGRVTRRIYAEGQSCPVGKVLIELDTGSAEADAPATKAAAEPSAAAPSRGDTATVAAAPSGAGVLATPATRKLARDVGVDIRAVAGTGPAGRVTHDDVKAATSGESSAPPAIESDVARRDSSGVGGGGSGRVGEAGDVRVPFRGLRKKIAENMVRSKHTAAHFTYVEEIDCTELVLLRSRANQRLAADGIKLSFLPFIVKATAGALEKFPQLNATLDEAAGEIVQRKRIHLGLATATDAGLMVPVVRDANGRSVVELAQEIDRLAAVTRSGKAAREDLSGSTFTITSLGALGGVMAAPIINYPEVAILGVHKISRRPAVVGDKIEI